MTMINALFITVALFTQVALSEELKSLHLDLRERVPLASTEQWQAVRILSNNRVKIEFTDLKKGQAKVFQGILESEVLISTETQTFSSRQYVISVWNSGNMSTIVRVFDPMAEKEKVLVYEKYSLGQIEYKVLPTGIEVTYNQARSLDPVPRIVKSTWKAGGP